jgi:hypothetical protein
MSAIATFTLPDAQVVRLFHNVAEATRQSTPELLRDVMKLYVADLTRQTYPKTKAEGANRVAKDIDKIVQSTDVDTIASWEAVSGGQTFPGRIFKRRGGAVYGVDDNELDFTGQKIPEHHAKYRLKNGRVSSAGSFTKDIGRWKFMRMLHTTDAIKKKYVRSKQAHVGTLKAGWNAAAILFKVKIVDWVAKHGYGQGTAREEIDWNTLQGSLIAENNVPYAQSKLGQSWVDFLASKRITDLTSGHYRMRWEKRMKREFESRKIS